MADKTRTSWLPDGEHLSDLMQTVRRNPVRTVLTSGGVFWGTLMLVLMLGFGNGLSTALSKKMSGMINNAAYLWVQATAMPYKGFKPGRRVSLRTQDIALLESLPEIDVVAPRNQLGGYRSGNTVRRGTASATLNVFADTPNYPLINPMNMTRGRFINALDIEEERKVVVLGEQAFLELYEPTEDPIGTYVAVNSINFQVVGTYNVMTHGDQGERQASSLHVPRSTYLKTFNQGDRVSWFMIGVAEDADASDAEQAMRAALAKAHQVHPEDRRAFGSYNTAEKFQRLQNLFQGVQVFVWLVGLATLLSGAIGVSNILLIVVRERTAEIGLRRAIGGTRRDIVRNILQEALLLTSVAGYLAIVVGAGLLSVARTFLDPNHPILGPPTLELSTVLMALAVLSLIGVLAGVLPAYRAAMIQPITALRTE